MKGGVTFTMMLFSAVVAFSLSESVKTQSDTATSASSKYVL